MDEVIKDFSDAAGDIVKIHMILTDAIGLVAAASTNILLIQPSLMAWWIGNIEVSIQVLKAWLGEDFERAIEEGYETKLEALRCALNIENENVN